MARSPGGPGTEFSWEEIWERLTGKYSTSGKKPFRKGPVLGALAGIAIAIWLLTGIYTVSPGEVAVVKRFGSHIRTDGPGLHYHLRGIESYNRVNQEQIRTAEIGFRTVSSDEFRIIQPEARVLTSDENIVEVQLVVQYRVSDADDYVFNVIDPETALHDAAEVAMRSVVGDHTIDYVMIEGRGVWPSEAMTYLQQLLDDYGSGLLVTNLKLQYAGPPDDVRDAFDEVQAAREDKQTLIRQAEGYAADIVPRARGEAQKIVLQANAYKEQRVLKAEGDAAKFLSVLKAHEVTAAFQALAGGGITEAEEALSQVGIFEVTSGDMSTDIAVEEIIEEVIKEGTENGVSIEVDEVSTMTRDNLYLIMKDLGVTDGISEAAELTGKKLISALDKLNLAEEYQEAYDEAIKLTKERLYLETMQEVLPATEKYILDSSTTGSILPFLPLGEMVNIPELNSVASGTGQASEGRQ
ncbi:MAG: FtsH protease activity modulator HflK [Dehalococcoidia bacterium]